MASDNKILTVSYGTFSCTLEGFDDPFSAMRSIAEYFRDLAADDRFFGAEPPTPDPQMLQSLAEKEVKRRIESRVENNGLVLRQMDQEDAQPAPAAPASPQPAPQAASSRTETPAGTPQEASQPAPTKTQAPEPAAAKPRTASATALAAHAAGLAASAATAETNTASIADKLERIRAAVALRSEAQFVEDQQSAGVTSAAVQPSKEETEDDLDADLELDHSVDDNVETDEIAEFSLDDMAVETAAAESAPVADEAVEEDEAQELAPDEGPVAKIAPPVVETTETETETRETADAHAPDINLAADIADAEAQSEDDAAEAPAPSRRVRVVKMRRTDFEAAAPQDPAPESDEVADRDADDMPALDEDLELTETLSAELDLDSHVAPGPALDDTDDDLLQDLAAITEDDTVSETPEIAADLIDDDLAADLADDPFEATDEDTAADDLTADLDAALATAPSEPSDTDDARNVFDASEASMSRLMDETDKEMAKGENTRRRNAIQHLKAAVGAIRAEKSHTSDTDAPKDETEAYKEDLAQVVKPSRPASPATPTRRNLPPLMLVSEQRIDDPKSAASQAAGKPVQPRRLSTSALALKEEEEFQDDLAEATSLDTNMSFQEFAEANGAVDLADVIEAAAAYLYFVEDRETVVRPKIMRTVRKVIPEGVPHEDRLRAFGKLLRQGKIKKVARGQFAVAPTTHFKPH